METVLELEQLAKTYKTGWRRMEHKAVVDISLVVPAGTAFGLLGPNGAGKTTVLKMAVGFLRPDSGHVTIFGQKNEPKVRRQVGFLPEQPYFYPYSTAESALNFYARLFGIKKAVRRQRISSLLTKVGLSDAAKLPLGKFSKGMLQRFGIAQALINDPELLIVDEPTSGLDPIGQVEVRKILTALNLEGRSILLSSHYLCEVENICHEVAIINKGLVIARGKIDKLLDAGNIYTVSASHMPKNWQSCIQAIKTQRSNGFLRLTVKKNDLESAIDDLRLSGGSIEDVRKVTKSLEKLFIELVGSDVDGN